MESEEKNKNKAKTVSNALESGSSNEEGVSELKDVPPLSPPKAFKPGGKRTLTTTGTEPVSAATFNIPTTSENVQKTVTKSDNDLSGVKQSVVPNTSTGAVSGTSILTASVREVKDIRDEESKDDTTPKKRYPEPNPQRSRSVFTVESVRDEVPSSIITTPHLVTMSAPITPTASSSQKVGVSPGIAQDVSPPKKSLKSDTLLLNKDRIQSESSTVPQVNPIPLEDTSPSRSISLERVYSRLDVRVSTQTEGATSQGDVLTTRTVDTDVSNRTTATRSAGVVTVVSSTAIDSAVKPSTSMPVESKNNAVSIAETGTVASPESVHATRSILRRSESRADNSPSKADVHASFQATPAPDPDRPALKQFSKITFPSLSSSVSSTVPLSNTALVKSAHKGRDESIRSSRVSSRSTFTDFTGYSTSVPTVYTFVDDLDEAHQRVGGNSWKTWRILIAASAPGFVSMWLLVSTVLMTSPVRFHCKIDRLDEEKWSDRRQRDLLSTNSDDNVCQIPDVDYAKLSRMTLDEAWPIARRAYLNNSMIPCKEYVFETGNLSLVAEFKLVCDRRDLLLLYQVIAGVGMSVGALCFGTLSDHFGRRTVFIASLVMYTLCFPMSVIIPDFWALTISHFLCGIANSGCFISAMVLMTEWSRVSNRPVFGAMMFLPWGMGLTFIALVGFYVPEWWYLQITIAVPASLLLVCAFVLPESPRWLYAVGKRSKAWNTLRKEFKEIRPSQAPMDDFTSESFQHRLNTTMKYCGYLGTKRELRWRLMICMLSNLGAGAIYYMVILRTGTYGIVVHFLLALCGVLEMAACGIAMVILSLFGPRPTCSILYLLCGACISFTTFVPQTLTTVVLFLLLFARVVACVLFFSQIIQTCELFPTLIRGTALGIVLMFTYVCGFVIPLVVVGCATALNQNTVKNCYGILAIVCGVLILLLPVTRRRYLTNTMEDVSLEAAHGIEVSCRNLY